MQHICVCIVHMHNKLIILYTKKYQALIKIQGFRQTLYIKLSYVYFILGDLCCGIYIVDACPHA
jgi:hypothetical protein